MIRSKRLLLAASLGAALHVSQAGATITPVRQTGTATELAAALSAQRGLVRSAAFSAAPPFSRPMAISTTPLAGFPSPSARASNGRYAILSTGDARLASRPNDSTFTGREAGGPSIRGAFDVTILRLDLTVPAKANCLKFDVRLLSDEYREAVGTDYGDAFLAEIDASTWKVLGPPTPGISAPFNIARDTPDGLLTITKTGLSAMTVAAAGGTTYDGATARIRVAGTITPGSHILYLSIFDRGDRVYDTSAFVDNLRAVQASSCATRAVGA